MRLIGALVAKLGSLLNRHTLHSESSTMSDNGENAGEAPRGSQGEGAHTDSQPRESGAESMEMSEGADEMFQEAVRRERSEQVMEHVAKIKKIISKTFRGTGKADDLESDWTMYRQFFFRTCINFGFPDTEYGELILNLLDGPALKAVLVKNLQTFDEIDAHFSSAPFRPADTDYSVRTRWYQDRSYRALTAAQIKQLLQRIDRDASKAPNPPTDVEKIVAVQVNLPATVRSQVMLNERNQPYTDWSQFVEAVIAHVNAGGSNVGGSSSNGAGSSNGNTGQPRPPTPSKRQRPSSFEQPRRTSMDRQQQQQQGGNGQAGPSRPGNGNAKEHPPCTGCGSHGHQVWWKDRAGKPICKHYDARKDKRADFQKKA